MNRLRSLAPAALAQEEKDNEDYMYSNKACGAPLRCAGELG